MQQSGIPAVFTRFREQALECLVPEKKHGNESQQKSFTSGLHTTILTVYCPRIGLLKSMSLNLRLKTSLEYLKSTKLRSGKKNVPCNSLEDVQV